ncbi:MAG: urease accessory protein UreD [Planctomycetota bacterium]
MVGTALATSPVGSSADAERSIGIGRLAVKLVAGRSRVVDAYSTNPLRLLTPTPPPQVGSPDPPRVFVTGYGGGLLSGDRINMDVAVADSASLLLSTQASTKVYHADADRRAARQVVRATVGPEARLAVIPDPVVCFADAIYEQDQRFELQTGAGLAVLDWFTAGRTASGESWAFSRYASRTRIAIDGREVAHDALTIDKNTPGGVALFGRGESFTVMATLWLAGSAAPIGRSWIEGLTTRDLDRTSSLQASGGVLCDGLTCVARWAGQSVASVQSAIQEALASLSQAWRIGPWDRKW